MNWKIFYISLSFLLFFLGSGALNAQCSNFSVVGTVTDASCGNNGRIELTITGSGQYYINWSRYRYWGHLASGVTFLDSLSVGHYYVQVTDQNLGCTEDLMFTVGGPLPLYAAVIPDTNSCPTTELLASPRGGTSPYTYAWSTGANTPAISNLPADQTYSLTVTDAMGCVEVVSYHNDTAACSLPLDICNLELEKGFRNCPIDTLDVRALNGVAPYNYNWSTGAIDIDNWGVNIAVSAPGTYTVTVTDASSCFLVDTIEVPSSNPIQITPIVTPASCGQNDGVIDLNVTGGSGGYFYYWSNGSREDHIDSLAQNSSYYVFVRDSLNTDCSNSAYNINVGGHGQISPVVIAANCQNTMGEIALNPVGFSNPQFVWSTGDTGSNLTNLSAGTYTVTITGDSCQTARSFFLEQDSSCLVRISGRVTNNTTGGTCTAAIAEAQHLIRLLPSGQLVSTDQNGFYSFELTQAGNYTLELVPRRGGVQLCPAGNITVNATTLGTNYTGNDFVVTNPSVNDLYVNFINTTVVAPGFSLHTHLDYCNAGDSPQNVSFTLDYDNQLEFNPTATDPRYMNIPWYTYHNASIVAHDAVNKTITFEANNINPGSCGAVRVSLYTPTTVPLGNQVTNSVTISPVLGDATPANNSYTESWPVIGSWDPNEIVLRPTRSGDPRGQAEIYTQDEVLDYTIHFQNLGTAPAYTVVIRDTLDASLDATTLANLQFSHDGTMSVENGNILVFTFNNINLPDADTDEAGSHGFVKYSINRDPNLPLGAVIPNKAAIYFDFNAPVITNLSEATISAPTSTRQLELLNSSFKVFPNPSQGQYFVSFEQSQPQDLHLQVYNMQGQLLIEQTQADAPTSGQMSFDLSNFPAAHYLLRINGQDQLIQKQ
ncbi:T9SS type A sorting domain-containing protein [Saprospira sp. CCB-QB6]|uniref:DUF7619 domain-containing protein n=1 Tax=Saprospira sp. CCB-QB6 TaxID=3023936 RepID=UPI0023494F5D|nr:T9SS type A sorting domain-containing protein [Saprospira sp. CCB-QB6]WCL82673.1 T9SS type A sorting domain-containing protein [Saprospira sp. CCB-QB6]